MLSEIAFLQVEDGRDSSQIAMLCPHLQVGDGVVWLFTGAENKIRKGG